MPSPVTEFQIANVPNFISGPKWSNEQHPRSGLDTQLHIPVCSGETINPCVAVEAVAARCMCCAGDWRGLALRAGYDEIRLAEAWSGAAPLSAVPVRRPNSDLHKLVYCSCMYLPPPPSSTPVCPARHGTARRGSARTGPGTGTCYNLCLRYEGNSAKLLERESAAYNIWVDYFSFVVLAINVLHFLFTHKIFLA